VPKNGVNSISIEKDISKIVRIRRKMIQYYSTVVMVAMITMMTCP
jgi:hypothetical protein